ncbi:CHASE3 domain-containing protein [Cupriavidus sp.]|jgi:signal transduction histidine kinase|uniref:sensor histidine kinase n=1 Tax=Cupriavidus sp. TaxID=1873897 RepID=UPI0025B90B4A|nr:CHASE3 domain-containing protein [Cupriavidus sp.]MCA3182133.1 CHASE3 domain-containing protein [Cupriavidus sp.]MCA3190604.1 CHASE3 domain-containing protein [Cupriavidus sp.]MCA3197309.1 CHASE3 domain-containing protein [Cupriavidus sp.]MCA3202586.1 CHASE3 domain-containing protein [Cupriavidus sp.]MCA3209583.1 CHASE3 domain-containing protein [Cupriavidus sp.]
MAKHSLLLRNTLLLAGGIVLTLAVLIASETGNLRLREGYTEAIRSQQLQSDLGALIAELVNAEAGQRGFLLTGKESYLDPYYKALPHISELMSRIRQHYANDPEGLRQFGEASQFVTRKLNEMALTLVYGKRDVDVALDMIRTDFGKQTMESARRGLEQLQMRESGTVTHNLEAAEHDLQLSRYGIGLLTAINILLLVAVGMGHQRRMTMAEAAREQLEEESARLDRKVRARTRQLSALAAHLQRVTEDEKTRLSRELHDELGAILTAIKLDLHWVKMRVQQTHPDARDKITRVMQHADQAIQIKRRLIEDLRPTVLLNLGLREAIVQQVEDVGARNQWETQVDLPDSLPPLRDNAAIALYRIVQESLNNASKYAEAKHISVSLACTPQQLTLTIRDDGRGLPPDFDAGSIAGHHGLLGMEQRVLALGGTMHVDSAPGQGVSIRVEVPLTTSVLAPPEEATEA